MADKRMFSKKITDSDAFISLPASAQAFYLHLNQGADDDGFNNQVNLSMLKAHASPDDLKLLLDKKFIIQFDGGVVVIKHWLINNSIRKDRKKETNYGNLLDKLFIKENGAYTLNKPNDNQLTTNCQPSIDKYRLDKYSNINSQQFFEKNDECLLGFKERKHKINWCDKNCAYSDFCKLPKINNQKKALPEWYEQYKEQEEKINKLIKNNDEETMIDLKDFFTEGENKNGKN